MIPEKGQGSPENAERAAQLTRALGAVENDTLQASIESLMQIARLVPELIAVLDDCAAQIRRDSGEIQRLNTRISVLSAELAAARGGRGPALRLAPMLSNPVSSGPDLPAGVMLREIQALSGDTFLFSFEVEGIDAPVEVETSMVNGTPFLKTRSDFLESEPGWRSGSDRHGAFWQLFETDLEEGDSGFTTRLARYCFACLSAA